MPIMINTRITILSTYCLPGPKTNLTYTTRCADFFQSGGLPGIQPLKRSPGSNVHFNLIPGTSNVFSRLERNRNGCLNFIPGTFNNVSSRLTESSRLASFCLSGALTSRGATCSLLGAGRWSCFCP